MVLRREMPSISNLSHTHNTYTGSDMHFIGTAATSPFTTGTTMGGWADSTTTDSGIWALGGGGGDAAGQYAQQMRDLMQRQQAVQAPPIQPASPKGSKTSETFMGRRLVQVFISDPDENLPLESALLYSGQQKMTDLTDQELFFEIDIKSILDTHNAIRAKTLNKKVKERTEYLEPTRVSKLKMVVVNVATF